MTERNGVLSESCHPRLFVFRSKSWLSKEEYFLKKVIHFHCRYGLDSEARRILQKKTEVDWILAVYLKKNLAVSNFITYSFL